MPLRTQMPLRTRLGMILGGLAALAAGVASTQLESEARPWPAQRRDTAERVAPLPAAAWPIAPQRIEPAASAEISPAAGASGAAEAQPASGSGDYGIAPELLPALDRYRDSREAADREEALFELALADDPQVLRFLLDELRVAHAAQHSLLLEAVVQYASRDAVPALRALAEESRDSEERAELIEAAEFLELPSLTEHLLWLESQGGAGRL